MSKHPIGRGHRISLNRQYKSIDTDPMPPSVNQDKKPKHSVRCPQSGKDKLLFETREQAERFVKYNYNTIKGSNGYAPFRAYYCRYCLGWHLTSKPKKEYQHKTA